MNRRLIPALIISLFALTASAKEFRFVLPSGYPIDKITTTNGVIFGEIPYNTMVYEAPPPEPGIPICEIARRHYPYLESAPNLETFNDRFLEFLYDIKTADGKDPDSVIAAQSLQEKEVSKLEAAKELLGSRRTTNIALISIALLTFASLFKRSRK